MYWGSSTVQVSFIKENRMRNWDQNDLRFISKMLKFYKKTQKKVWKKTVWILLAGKFHEKEAISVHCFTPSA